VKKKLGPVYLKIEHCSDCPFNDEDYGSNICERGVRLPINWKIGQETIPPKNCPLRKQENPK